MTQAGAIKASRGPDDEEQRAVQQCYPQAVVEDADGVSN